MADHLNECDLFDVICCENVGGHISDGRFCTACGLPCVCAKLRACEARVQAFYDAEIERQGAQWEASCRQYYRSGSDDGKALALDAARDAVPHEISCWGSDTEPCDCFRPSVIAAIDALRGKSNG